MLREENILLHRVIREENILLHRALGGKNSSSSCFPCGTGIPEKKLELGAKLEGWNSFSSKAGRKKFFFIIHHRMVRKNSSSSCFGRKKSFFIVLYDLGGKNSDTRFLDSCTAQEKFLGMWSESVKDPNKNNSGVWPSMFDNARVLFIWALSSSRIWQCPDFREKCIWYRSIW